MVSLCFRSRGNVHSLICLSSPRRRTCPAPAGWTLLQVVVAVGARPVLLTKCVEMGWLSNPPSPPPTYTPYQGGPGRRKLHGPMGPRPSSGKTIFHCAKPDPPDGPSRISSLGHLFSSFHAKSRVPLLYSHIADSTPSVLLWFKASSSV